MLKCLQKLHFCSLMVKYLLYTIIVCLQLNDILKTSIHLQLFEIFYLKLIAILNALY